MKYFYITFLCIFFVACSGNKSGHDDEKCRIDSNIQNSNRVINNSKKPIIINLDINDIMTDEEAEKYYNENGKDSVNYIYISDTYSPFINNNNSIIVSIDEKDNTYLVEPEPQVDLFIETGNTIINTDTSPTLDIE